MFQFHKVQLTPLPVLPVRLCQLFQFHKVQLTLQKSRSWFSQRMKFQFHKVQLTPSEGIRY